MAPDSVSCIHGSPRSKNLRVLELEVYLDMDEHGHRLTILRRWRESKLLNRFCCFSIEAVSSRLEQANVLRLPSSIDNEANHDIRFKNLLLSCVV